MKRRSPRAFRLPVVGGEDVANVVHLERGGGLVVETGDAERANLDFLLFFWRADRNNF